MPEKPEGVMADNRISLESVEENDYRLLEVAHAALSRENGSNTPSETLIQILLLNYGHDGRLDPDETDKALAEFHSDLEYAVAEAARITKQYPDLVMDAEAALSAA